MKKTMCVMVVFVLMVISMSIVYAQADDRLWQINSEFQNNDQAINTIASNGNIMHAVYYFYRNYIYGVDFPPYLINSNQSPLYPNLNLDLSNRFAQLILSVWCSDPITTIKPFSVDYLEQILQNTFFYFAGRSGGYVRNLRENTYVIIGVENSAGPFVYLALHEFGHALGLWENLTVFFTELLMGFEHPIHEAVAINPDPFRPNRMLARNPGIARNTAFLRVLYDRLDALGRIDKFWTAAYTSNVVFAALWNEYMGDIVSFEDLWLAKGVDQVARSSRTRDIFEELFRQHMGMNRIAASQQFVDDWRTMLDINNPHASDNETPSVREREAAKQRFFDFLERYISFTEHQNVASFPAVHDSQLRNHLRRYQQQMQTSQPIDTSPIPITRILRFTIDNTTFTNNAASHTLEAAPFIQNDRTMVPLRVIGEALGATSLAHNAGIITFNINGQAFTMTVGQALPNNMGTPVIVAGRTFVPLAFIINEMGATARWDSAARAAYIYID